MDRLSSQSRPLEMKPPTWPRIFYHTTRKRHLLLTRAINSGTLDYIDNWDMTHSDFLWTIIVRTGQLRILFFTWKILIIFIQATAILEYRIKIG